MAPLKLLLSPNNPSNCMLIPEGEGYAMYTSFTQIAGENRDAYTHVKDEADEFLARLEWRDVRSDKVTIGEGPSMLMSDWMKKSKLPFKDTATFNDEKGREFKWKGFSAGLDLELWAPFWSKRGPVLRFIKPLPRANPPRPAHLLLDTDFFTPKEKRAQHVAVVGFLFLEKSRRMRENSMQNFGDAEGISGMMVGPGQAGNVTVANGGV